MRFGWTRTQKPPIGTPLDLTNSLTEGLAWFVPQWEGGGSKVVDIIGGVNLPIGAGPSWRAGAFANHWPRTRVHRHDRRQRPGHDSVAAPPPAAVDAGDRL